MQLSSGLNLSCNVLHSEVDATAELKLAEEYGVRGQEFCVPIMFTMFTSLFILFQLGVGPLPFAYVYTGVGMAWLDRKNAILVLSFTCFTLFQNMCRL